MKWLSHTYTRLPSLLGLPPTLHAHPKALGRHRAPSWGLWAVQVISTLCFTRGGARTPISTPRFVPSPTPCPHTHSLLWVTIVKIILSRTCDCKPNYRFQRGERYSEQILSHSKNIHWTNFKKKGRQGCRIITKIKKTGYMIRKLIPSNNILNLPNQGRYPSVECRELYSIFYNNV